MQEESKDVPLTQDEIRLRDFLLERDKGYMNIAPGSPAYDRLMGVNPVRRSEFLGATPEPKRKVSPVKGVIPGVLVWVLAAIAVASMAHKLWEMLK